MVSNRETFTNKGYKIAAKKKLVFLLILPYFAWKNWCGAHLITRVEPILLHAESPSYYTRGGLKTGRGCRASIAPAWSRRVDAWTRVRVDACTRGRMETSTAPFFKNVINHPNCKNSRTSRDMLKLAIYPSIRGL